MLSQADLALTHAKRVLLPGLGKEPLPRVSVGRNEREGEERDPSSPPSVAAAMLSKLDVSVTEPGRPGAFREEREGSDEAI